MIVRSSSGILNAACVITLLLLGASAHAQVDFNRDILPILSDRCFHCHGPDEENREADLRLDLAESVFESRGDYAIVKPGEPSESELLLRIVSDDESLRMPPVDSHRKPLSEAEVAKFKAWINSGAEWAKHWAFIPPKRPDLPDDSIHPIDAFINREIARRRLEPVERAAKHTLLRRVSFDLTGLPPDFAKDADQSSLSQAEYLEFVDQLLESPHYGERMAMWWLDAARYADTDGYQQDATRNNWPWRDWVVDAFNTNMPFDQFTVEQFAGDLLPNATPENILATCFHRNHMANGEGGRHPEESRIDYTIDRVNTMGTVWLGLTLGCCQCHSHKFDPISQHDYYSLFAFFNSIDEDGKAGSNAKPFLKYKSPYGDRSVRESQQLVDTRKDVERQILAQARLDFKPWLEEQVEVVQGGFQAWKPLMATELYSVEGTHLHQTNDAIIQASGPSPFQDDYHIVAGHEQLSDPQDAGRSGTAKVTAIRLEVLPHASHTDSKLSRGKTGEFILTDVKLGRRVRGNSQLHDVEIASAVADVEKKAQGRNYGNVKDTLDDDPRNGWTTETHNSQEPHVAIFALAEPLFLESDEELIFVMLHRSTYGDSNIGRFRISVSSQPGKAVRSLAPMPMEKLAEHVMERGAEPLDEGLNSELLDQLLTEHAAYQTAKQELSRASAQLSKAKQAAKELNIMVLAERQEPRQTHVLERGVWDKKGDEVHRAFPSRIFTSPQAPTSSRLDLAQWLVNRNNPLTARVVVNQLWQLCFGHGLVRTPEDFGLQGEPPSHPELLDWLAVELMETDWDIQHILRLMVTSEAYQRSSRFTAESQRVDPENRFYARATRYRLPAWMIRDSALKLSGLLNPATGGPPVLPYQPEGVWAEMFMGRFQYAPSQGPAQFRRTLYAFWRRSAAPTFLFDSSQRRVCEVRPRQTNTPLHALTLLNDLSQREAARALAQASLTTDSPGEAVVHIFSKVLHRNPRDQERVILLREYERALHHYEAYPEDAIEFLSFGQPELRQLESPVSLASATVVASMILNLDEAITHE